MEEPNVFFSIIVSMYNIEKYIENTIESILANNFDNYEILLINDGCTDNTPIIAKEFVDDKKIFLYTKDNGGISSARNVGLDKANGKYILFLDGDDSISNDMLCVLYGELIKNDIDLLVFGRNEVYEDKRKIPYLLQNKEFKNSKDYLHFSLANATYRTNVWDKVYKRKLIESNKFRFDEGYLYEDMYFVLQYLSVCKKIKTIGNYLYNYVCDNATSITKTVRRKDLDVLFFLQRALEFSKMCDTLECSDIYVMLQRFALSSIVNKYVLIYNKEPLAKEIINALLNDESFKLIIKNNARQHTYTRDFLFGKLILIAPKLYIRVMKVLMRRRNK